MKTARMKYYKLLGINRVVSKMAFPTRASAKQIQKEVGRKGKIRVHYRKFRY